MDPEAINRAVEAHMAEVKKAQRPKRNRRISEFLLLLIAMGALLALSPNPDPSKIPWAPIILTTYFMFEFRKRWEIEDELERLAAAQTKKAQP